MKETSYAAKGLLSENVLGGKSTEWRGAENQL